jgi:hypothetical protein
VPRSEWSNHLCCCVILCKVLLGLTIAHPSWLGWSINHLSHRLNMGLSLSSNYPLRPTKLFILVLSMNILNVVFLSWGNSVLLSMVSDGGHNNLSDLVWWDSLSMLAGSSFKIDSLVGNNRSSFNYSLLDNSLLLSNGRSIAKALLDIGSRFDAYSLSTKIILLARDRGIRDSSLLNNWCLESTSRCSWSNWANTVSKGRSRLGNSCNVSRIGDGLGVNSSFCVNYIRGASVNHIWGARRF